MNKFTQWIIIWLLALNAIWVFMLITKIDDTRVAIVKRMTDNKNDIIAEIWKSNIQLDKIQQNTWELQDVLLDDFSYYMKKIVNE